MWEIIKRHLKVRSWYYTSYHFKHWLFRWDAEADHPYEGSICFTVCNILHFVKYKEHTLIIWGNNRRFVPARTYINARK